MTHSAFDENYHLEGISLGNLPKRSSSYPNGHLVTKMHIYFMLSRTIVILLPHPASPHLLDLNNWLIESCTSYSYLDLSKFRRTPLFFPGRLSVLLLQT